MYSCSSFMGFVSSKRRWQRPPNSRGDAEVEADRLGVADVEVAVRLGREAGDDGLVPPLAKVGGDDLADEVAALGRDGVSVLTAPRIAQGCGESRRRPRRRARSGELHGALGEPQPEAGDRRRHGAVRGRRRPARRRAGRSARPSGGRTARTGRRGTRPAPSGRGASRAAATHWSKSFDQSGGGASRTNSRRNGRPWVMKPLPMMRTPSSRSGRRRAPSSSSAPGIQRSGGETCSTGTSASGYMATRGT